MESARGLQERAFGVSRIAEGKKGERTFEFQNSTGIFIAPLESSAGIGFDCWASRMGVAGQHLEGQIMVAFFENYLQKKQELLRSDTCHSTSCRKIILA